MRSPYPVIAASLFFLVERNGEITREIHTDNVKLGRKLACACAVDRKVNSAASAQTSGRSPPRDAAPARQLAYSFGVTANHNNDDKPVTIPATPALLRSAGCASRCYRCSSGQVQLCQL